MSKRKNKRSKSYLKNASNKEVVKINILEEPEYLLMEEKYRNTKELLDEKIHEGIAIRVDAKKAEIESNRKHKELQNLIRENKKLQIKLQEVQVEKKTAEQQLRNDELLIGQVKQAETELAKLKIEFYEVLDNQKETIVAVNQEREMLLTTVEKQTKQLQELKKERNHFKERYNRVMNTKIMKWTGKYWKLRKKMRLKNK